MGLIKLRQQVSDRVMDPNDISKENLPEAAEWHMRLYRKSLHKQAKLRNILSLMPSPGGKGCIDVGGGNGVISRLLRQEGGTWQSVDQTEKAVNSMLHVPSDAEEILTSMKTANSILDELKL